MPARRISITRIHPRGSSPPVAEIPDISPGTGWVIPRGDSEIAKFGRKRFGELFNEAMALGEFTARAAPLAILLKHLHSLGGEMTHGYQYLANELSKFIPTNVKTIGELLRDEFVPVGLVRMRSRWITSEDGKKRRTSNLIELTLPSKLGKRIRRFRPRVMRDTTFLPAASYLPHPQATTPVYTQQRGHRLPLLQTSMTCHLLLSGLPTLKVPSNRALSSVLGHTFSVDNFSFFTK